MFRPRLLTLYLILLMSSSAACGLLSDQPPKTEPTTSTGESVGSSKEVAFQCLSQGELGCAKENYCGLSGDAPAALRCCLSGFLENYFSDNTKHLGQLLGYTPLSFQEIRGMSREDILKAKALPFAELLLQSDAETPKVSDLLEQWAGSLSNGKADTQDLRQTLDKFAQGLQASADCVDHVAQGFQSDEMEKEIFAMDNPLSISPRDIDFVDFALSTLAYGLQAVAQYESGFAQFPTLPLSDSFLLDINGHAGADDTRLGDLEDAGISKIVTLYPLLQRSATALKAYSDLKAQPSKIDDYINWRFAQDKQEKASEILKAAYQSLTDAQWVDLPTDENKQINLSNLAKGGFLPNSKNLNPDVDILVRDESHDVELNDSYVRAWVKTLVRDKVEAPQK